jgi:ribosomal protein S18 acetylase RimI-like enzyme
MALWDIYLTPSKWRRGEISWLSGRERERAEQLIWPLWDTRERLWLDQKYLYCHVVAVHPEYQRRGIGQMLMEYGIDIAQKVRLPIYIESSRDGMRLYEKIGCRRLKQQPVDKSKTGKPQESNEVEEHDGAVSWVWFPKGGEEILPATVELAPNESC